jgi:hypothetical protein
MVVPRGRHILKSMAALVPVMLGKKENEESGE